MWSVGFEDVATTLNYFNKSECTITPSIKEILNLLISVHQNKVWNASFNFQRKLYARSTHKPAVKGSEYWSKTWNKFFNLRHFRVTYDSFPGLNPPYCVRSYLNPLKRLRGRTTLKIDYSVITYNFNVRWRDTAEFGRNFFFFCGTGGTNE